MYSKGVFTWENSHRRESHTGMTFWFCIGFTLWLSHFISRYLKVHFMLIKYTCDSKSQTLCMRYLFQSTGRLISHWDWWSFRVYMIPLRDFVPEWNSRPSTRTWVNSLWGDSRRHDILWWYHVNKYRAMRSNRSEVAPGRKSNQVSCKHPLSCQRTPPAITYYYTSASLWKIWLVESIQSIHNRSFSLSRNEKINWKLSSGRSQENEMW